MRRGWLLAAIPPVITLGAWLGSGRETFSKTERVVEVSVQDDLFGDTTTRKEFRRGPLAGWYVGLDAVAGVTALSVGTAIAVRLLGRGRRTLKQGGMA